MAAPPSIDLSGWLSEHLEQASPDLLRAMLRTFVDAPTGAEADAVCGASSPPPKRVGTSVRFIRRLVAQRRISYLKVGRHLRISSDDLDAFIAAGRVEADVR